MIKNNWHCLSLKQVFLVLRSDEEGLDKKEAETRLKEFGLNKLPERKRTSGLILFLSQFRSPLIYILVIAGFVCLVLKEYIDMSVIFGAVILNTIFGFVQENKASKALLKLKQILKPKALVVRENREKQIDGRKLVPGDVIVLRPGDKVPADARLFEVNNLAINEAALTGEWLAATKHTEILKPETAAADQDNMVFMGTIVEQGQGRAMVVETGSRTQLGQIALMVKQAKEEKTPFQKKLAHFAKIIGLLITFICLLILITGLSLAHSFFEMFTTSVAVAVAAIPEGLPMAMTVILALGMQRILKKKGLVRKLVAAETLGSTNIICTDKTGTLTEGKMKVTEYDSAEALKIAVLCSEAIVENPDDNFDDWVVRGRPTDKALLLAGARAGFDKQELERKIPQIDILPFSSERKYIASLRQADDHNVLYVCGAPEVVLEMCKKKDSRQKYEEMTKRGLRVVGAAYKKIQNSKLQIPKNIKNLHFVGFIGLSDPIRQTVKKTIKICQQAGLRLIIVTGDHKLTAKAVALQLGMLVKEENILEGKDLVQMNDEQLKEKISQIKIFARVEPSHKIRIIEAWQNRGEVVAMTGDGVNDAPALKKADIGVALGSGTDVAKETSDLVILTDNFNIIVAAIEQGRVILDNIRKVITYLLSDSFTEVILIVGALSFGLPLPLLPVQILWVNFIEDGLPNFALAFEKKEKDVMQNKPTGHKMPLLTSEMKIIIFVIGLITDLILLGIFFWLWRNSHDLAYIRTIIFAALAIDSLFYVFSCRSLRQSIWHLNPFSNRYLVGAVFVGFLMLGAAIYIPLFQTLLRTVPLGLKEWLIIAGVGIINILAIELTKWQFIVREKNERRH